MPGVPAALATHPGGIVSILVVAQALPDVLGAPPMLAPSEEAWLVVSVCERESFLVRGRDALSLSQELLRGHDEKAASRAWSTIRMIESHSLQFRPLGCAIGLVGEMRCSSQVNQ